jgi:anhydro-N-acetylmuramic acid kinase
MSGTSMDGIDAAILSFDPGSLQLHHANSYDYPAELRQRLKAAASTPLDQDIDELETLDRLTGECFRDAALHLLQESGMAASEIAAIGSHGQTVRHCPDSDAPFSLQIGNAHIIAAGTGITTVADFRTADIKAGGQGAPLVPPFHHWLFGDASADRVVLNIGGIANITVLPQRGEVTGFDTGPGNTLMDNWIYHIDGSRFDAAGALAASGNSDTALLQRLLGDPYFAMPAPKSTGLEYFNSEWLRQHALEGIIAADVQSTLCDLTVLSIADAIEQYAEDTTAVFVCGGGAHNAELMRRLRHRLQPIEVQSTAQCGLHPDWVEAAAFAWLASRTLAGLPGNLPSVTGASAAVVLGTIVDP